ncbi:MAG TPA: glycoside hydrolase family 127 protein [Candidatus Phocaeicola gallistercoris]|nr:glycoside hydrolase family 127 protein [Candidatus Phocaeicola gallistercoris]
MKNKVSLFLLGGLMAFVGQGALISCSEVSTEVQIVDRPITDTNYTNYVSNRAPLHQLQFVKLPVGSIKPEGWLRECLERQRDGLNGHLGEISAWLDKNNNAWLSNGGDHGWEEVPYWLRGYGDLAYILEDEQMIAETKRWIEGAIASKQPDGYFGPINESNGVRELWVQMLMMWCMQSYYEYTGDERVIDVMTDYCHWQLTVPDEKMLKGYWEGSRAGDNMLSVMWLYNRTGDKKLLELLEKLHRTSFVWTDPARLPNWHNVNIAQGFREPATYYMLTGDSAHLQASYNVFDLVRRCFGQVPGGMFGGDENSRIGYIDPRQGVETCGMVEQMTSDEILLCMTGDPMWADNCEDVAFNSYPAALMPDFRALRYITSPNLVQSDSKNHAPGIDNNGPFLAMNPFSSRCCQHNHGMGWPYYANHLILATTDGGVAAALYSASTTHVKVADAKEIVLHEETHYPFDETVSFTIESKENVRFPFYLRIPAWAAGAEVKVNDRLVKADIDGGKYVRLEREWKDGDKILLSLPMQLTMRTWQANRNSVSVNYGPLTLSLKIKERYVKRDSKETAIWDSRWQENADASKWPTFEIYPDSPWNYALVLDKDNPLSGLEVVHKEWPEDNYPFTIESVPLEVKATGRRIPSWTIDETNLCGVLPPENAVKEEKEAITLIPMGAARLRISAFPNTYE